MSVTLALPRDAALHLLLKEKPPFQKSVAAFGSLRISVEKVENVFSGPTISLGGERSATGTAAVVLKLVSLFPTSNTGVWSCGKANDYALLGTTEVDRLQIADWIEWSVRLDHTADSLVSRLALFTPLQSRVFLLGNFLSLADFFVWHSLSCRLSSVVSAIRSCDSQIQTVVVRWIDFVRSIFDSPTESLSSSLQQSLSFEPTSTEGAPVQKPRRQPAAKEEVPDFCHLDIRVGRIEEVRLHPDASSLYIETVSFGEALPKRTVLSGLVGRIALEQYVGRLACFVCNLKPAKLRGIVSEGMILVASSSDSLLELVHPPSDALPGDRVIVAGVDRKLFTPDATLKSQIMDAVKVHLAVDSDGIARWKEHAFCAVAPDFLQERSAGGRCTVPTVRNAPIS